MYGLLTQCGRQKERIQVRNLIRPFTMIRWFHFFVFGILGLGPLVLLWYFVATGSNQVLTTDAIRLLVVRNVTCVRRGALPDCLQWHVAFEPCYINTYITPCWPQRRLVPQRSCGYHGELGRLFKYKRLYHKCLFCTTAGVHNAIRYAPLWRTLTFTLFTSQWKNSGSIRFW